MTDARDQRAGSPEKKPPHAAAIIDAAKSHRPRIHGLETDNRKGAAGLDFLLDIPLKVNVILAETMISLGEILALETDSVVQLDKPSGDPVDICVENQKLGRGEVVVLHEKLRIRVLEIVPPSTGSKDTQPKRPEKE